jgi:hypothetical protein
MIYKRDLKAEGVFWASNLDRSIWNWWTGRLLLPRFGSGHEQSTDAMATGNGWAQAQVMRAWIEARTLPTRYRRKGVSFYSLSAEKKIHKRLAVEAWFNRLLAIVSSSSSDPLARTRWIDSSRSPLAPPCFNCFRRWWIELVQRLSLCARVQSLWDKIRRAWATIYRASCTES